MNKMYSICMISKYPPIQGGESSKTYWLMRGLGSRGHDIHVVTNAMEVEDEFREQLEGPDLACYMPEGVHVDNTDPFTNPHFIPYSKAYTEKLASLALNVVHHNNVQVLDTWYLLPYAVSGLLVKQLSGKPLVVRHAGSDITRLFSSPYLRPLFVELFRKADKIVTYPRYGEFFGNLGVPKENLFFNTHISVDTDAFTPSQPPLDLAKLTDKYRRGLPVISFLGKLHTTKGIFELIEALDGVEEEFLLVLVTGGKGIEHLRTRLDGSTIGSKTVIIDFMPPWRVPALIRASTCVVCPERDFPVAAHSPILPREVMACGTCLVLSNELYTKRPSERMKDGESVLVVDPKNIAEFRSVLRSLVISPGAATAIGEKAHAASAEIENFQAYLDEIEGLYAQVVDRNQG